MLRAMLPRDGCHDDDYDYMDGSFLLPEKISGF